MGTKEERLIWRMRFLGLKEEDLAEKFILGSGKGGQNLHKTSSCVYLKHLPTGLEVKCQKTRSREENRYLARWMLCQLLEAKRKNEQRKATGLLEKERRKKYKRLFSEQQKVLVKKRERSEKKAWRQKVRFEE
ncbi:MAG: peptide chain release factor-like protein [Parachlamydiales bacterium]|jgi:protein subunit release factor B